AARGVGHPEVAALIDRHADEDTERPLRRVRAVDRREQLAGRAELLHDVGARVTDVHRAPRWAVRVVDRDEGRDLELARARARDAGEAGRRGAAHLARVGAVLHAPAPRPLEAPARAEALDARVAAVGDVEPAAALVDRDAERRREL